MLIHGNVGQKRPQWGQAWGTARADFPKTQKLTYIPTTQRLTGTMREEARPLPMIACAMGVGVAGGTVNRDRR